MADKGKAPVTLEEVDEDFCDILGRKLSELSEVLTSLYNDYNTLVKSDPDVFTQADITNLLSEQAPLLKAVYDKENELYKYAKENCPDFLELYHEYTNAWRLLDYISAKDGFKQVQTLFRLMSLKPEEISPADIDKLNKELVDVYDNLKRRLASDELEITEQDVSQLLSNINEQIRNLVKIKAKIKVQPVSRSAQGALAKRLKARKGQQATTIMPTGGPPPPPPPPPPPAGLLAQTDPLKALREQREKARAEGNKLVPPKTRKATDNVVAEMKERQKARAREEPPQQVSESQINDLLRNILRGDNNIKREVCEYLRNKRHTRSDWNVGVQNPELLRIFKMLRDYYRISQPEARKKYREFRKANCDESELPAPSARPLLQLKSRRPPPPESRAQQSELAQLFARRREGGPVRRAKK